MPPFHQLFEKNYENVEAARQAARAKTQAPKSAEQAESGNYPKGKFWWRSMELAIENPKGSVRRDWKHDPPEWTTDMSSDYGYIRRTESEADGDHIDVFIGPDLGSEMVFIVDQSKNGRGFDEHKCMVGYTSKKEAKEAYLKCYSSGWKGFKDITPVTIGQFRKWVFKGDTSVEAAKTFKKLSESGYLSESYGKDRLIIGCIDRNFRIRSKVYDPDVAYSGGVTHESAGLDDDFNWRFRTGSQSDNPAVWWWTIPVDQDYIDEVYDYIRRKCGITPKRNIDLEYIASARKYAHGFSESSMFKVGSQETLWHFTTPRLAKLIGRRGFKKGTYFWSDYDTGVEFSGEYFPAGCRVIEVSAAGIPLEPDPEFDQFGDETLAWIAKDIVDPLRISGEWDIGGGGGDGLFENLVESGWASPKSESDDISAYARKLVAEMCDHASTYWSNARQGHTHEQHVSLYAHHHGGNNTYPYPKTAWDINCGECENFAEELASQFPGGEVLWLENLAGSDDYAHAIYFYGGRYYDSQHPDGVSDWKELHTYKGTPRDKWLGMQESRAAIKIDGKVFASSDETHYSALRDWVRKTQLPAFKREDGGGVDEASEWIYDNWPAFAKEHDVEEGFLDSSGNYFTREEAVGLLSPTGRERMRGEKRDWVDSSDFLESFLAMISVSVLPAAEPEEEMSNWSEKKPNPLDGLEHEKFTKLFNRP